MSQPCRVVRQQKEGQANCKENSGRFYPCEKDLFPISGMTLKSNRIGGNSEAQPSLDVPSHCIRGYWENRKPKNDKLKRGVVLLE